jgi:hypothetical protein
MRILVGTGMAIALLCWICGFDTFRFKGASDQQNGEQPNKQPKSLSRTLTKCGVLSRPGTYVLAQDVSSPNTCFSIQADHITLNLNGHTITYGEASASIPVFGILGVACWDPDYGKGNPCGGSFNNLTVLGGTITQGKAAPAFSHGIRLGQGPATGLTVHDMTFNLSADSSIPIYAYTGALKIGATVFNNTFINNVTVIRNRHQQQGQSIKLVDKVPGQVAIHANHITGGAQGGIYSAVEGTKIYNNIVSQRGTYTNDFGIYAWANRGEVFRNTVTPILGRGIQIAGGSAGAKVYENNVVVIEQKDNQEYEGCQIGGAYGIQFDDLAHDASVYRNTVVAKADQCAAQALRVTESIKGSMNVSHDNRYSAERVGGSEAIATGFGSGGATGFTSERDIFIGDTSAVAFDWDGAQNLIFRECHFVKGKNPSSNFVTFSFRNGQSVPVSNIHFVDSVFENRAGKTSTDMKPLLSEGDWPGPSEYFIDWSLTVSVKDQYERLLLGADVSITDALGKQVYAGRTDRNGSVSTALSEFRMYNTRTEIRQDIYTPYQLTVTKKGCSANPPTVSIEVKEPMSYKATLSCGPN